LNGASVGDDIEPAGAEVGPDSLELETDVCDLETGGADDEPADWIASQTTAMTNQADQIERLPA
jgi:hypothetical protein